MKKIRRILLAVCFTAIYVSFAYVNHHRAMWASVHSCGSDTCIEEAIRPYGFNHDVFEPITTVDILVAPIVSIFQ